MPDTDELEASLRDFVRNDLLIEDELRLDSALVTTARIDSADLVRLATHVERTTGITIPDQDITAKNFDSLARILEYVKSVASG